MGSLYRTQHALILWEAFVKTCQKREINFIRSNKMGPRVSCRYNIFVFTRLRIRCALVRSSRKLNRMELFGSSFGSVRKARMHYWSKYESSLMPHSTFFLGGYAIQGTGYVRSLGRPASHGCIRLAPGNAARVSTTSCANVASVVRGSSSLTERRSIAWFTVVCVR
jgi:hypothetical protein